MNPELFSAASAIAPLSDRLPLPTNPLEFSSFSGAATPGATTVGRSLVFVDTSVQNYQQLLLGLNTDQSVYLIDTQQDGIDQISQVLAGLSDVAAIHIVSHGNVGRLQLGNADLSGDTLGLYTDRLHQWATHLTEDADILLYGCDVAQGDLGATFVQQWATLTGADIAASNNLTGNTNLGGDWTLEVNTGTISTNLTFQSTVLTQYQNTLLTPISTAEYNNFKAGVNDFLALAQTGIDTIAFAQRLPLVGSQLASTAKFFQTLKNDLATAWATLEAIPVADLDSEDIRSTIATALAPYLPSGVTVTENASQVVFNLDLSRVVNSNLDFDLGLDAIGLSVGSSGNINTQLGYTLPLKFGVDLTSGEFFVDTSALNELAIGLTVTTPGLSATGRLGFLQVNVAGQDSQGNTTNFAGQFQVDLRDPNSDGRLTASELAGLSATQLLSSKLQANADLNLGLTTSFGGSAAFPSLKADLNIDWAFDPNNLNLLPTAAFNNARLNLGEFFSEFVNPVFSEIQKVLKPIQPVFDVLNTRMPVLSDIGPLRNIYDLDGNGTVTLLEFVGKSSGNESAAKFLSAVTQIAQFINSIPTGVGDVYIPLGNLRLNDSPTADLRTAGLLNSLNLNNASLVDDLTNLLPGVDNATRNILNNFKSSASNANFSGGLAFPLLQNPTTALGLLLGRNVSLFTLDLPALGTNFNVSQFFPILGPLGVRLSGSFDFQADFNFGYDTEGFKQFATALDGGSIDPSLIFNGFYISDTASPDGSGPDIPEVKINASVQASGEINVIVAAAGVGGGLFATVNLDLRDRDPATGNSVPYADGKIRLDELGKNFAANGPLGIFTASGKLTAGLNAYIKVGVDLPFVGFVGWQDSFDIATATLLDFDTDTSKLAPNPVLAEFDPTLGANVLRLNIGPNAAARLAGNLDDGDETFKVTRSADGSKLLVTAFGYTQEFDASTIAKIYAEGGAGDDVIDIAEDVAIPAELWGDFNPARNPGRSEFGNDKIFAGGAAAILHGGAGNDELTARSGDSQLFGEAGNDKLFGGTDNDTMLGGEGEDRLYANNGNDTLEGNQGDDYLDAGKGNDTVYGGDGNDRIKGGDGNDTLYGNDDTDIIEAGQGDDTAYGGAGNDYILDEGEIVVVSNPGSPSIPPGGPVLENVVVIPTEGLLIQVNLTAGGGNDTFYGETGNDVIFGQAGVDILYGQEGDDWLDGGADRDFLLGDLGSVDRATETVTLTPGSGGNDKLFGGSGNDELYGQDGNDELYGQANDDVLIGGQGNDLADGGADRDWVLGDEGSVNRNTNTVTLGAGNGNDTLFGGTGNDDLYGQLGDDLIFGDSARIVSVNGSTERVESIDTANGGNDRLFGGLGRDVLLGGTGDDRLFGSDETYSEVGAANLLFGDNGAVLRRKSDLFITEVASTNPTHGGRDEIQAQISDVIVGGSGGLDAPGLGGDRLFGSSGNDIILGDNGRVIRRNDGQVDRIEPLFNAQGGDDLIEGRAGSDILLGGGGNDRMIGGSQIANASDGVDYIFGGGGDDAIAGGNATITDNANPAARVITNLDSSAIVDWLFGDYGLLTFIGIGDDLNSRLGFKVLDYFAATLTKAQSILGEAEGNDRIVGNLGTDPLFGGGGNDTISGGENDDRIFADYGVIELTNGVPTRLASTEPSVGGNDIVEGGNGNDWIIGGAGNEINLDGGNGQDIILGDNGEILINNGIVTQTRSTNPEFGGNDVINGGNQSDIVIGGSGNDQIDGGADEAADILLGDNGIVYGNTANPNTANDIVSTDPTFGGRDQISGGAGDDIILGGSGGGDVAGQLGDTILGGLGDDILLGDGGRITRNSNNEVEKIETLFPSNGGNDIINGNEGRDIALGGAGDDTMSGDAGNDILLGDHGVVDFSLDEDLETLDVIRSIDPSLGGKDTIFGNDGDDIAIGGASDDTIDGNNGNDILLGDNGKITFDSNQFITQITTTDGQIGGNDRIKGSADNDRVLGGFGNDDLQGNAGEDILLGDNGVLEYALDNNPATLDLIATIDPAFGGNDVIQGNDDRDIALGGAQNDTINGNGGDDILLGDNGRITYSNGKIRLIETTDPTIGGQDSIFGDEGNDIILGGAEADYLRGNSGNDTILGDHGKLDYAYAGDDKVAADSNLDTLDFVTTTHPTLGGNDLIFGDRGSDNLLGGTGSDRIYGDEGLDTLDEEWQVVGNADLNGDGANDLLWRNQITGQNLLWVTRDGKFSEAVPLPDVNDLSWQVAGIFDLNGDGKKDILWRHSNGTLVAWKMNGITYDSGYWFNNSPDSNWQLLSIADLAGNGTPYFVWRHITGPLVLWQVQNFQRVNGFTLAYAPDANWQVEKITDVTNDGKADLVWRNTAANLVAIWVMDRDKIINSQVFTHVTDSNWIIAGFADFNKDGKTDWLWRHRISNGAVIWQMNGVNLIGGEVFNNAPALSWQIASLNDYTGDGQADVVWRHQALGLTAFWQLEGANLKQGWFLPYADEKVFDSTSADLILGDHGKLYPALLRDRNYVSIDTAANQGGGDDILFGNQGDDTILGQQGQDIIYGGSGEDDILGGHNVRGGADSNDQVDGGANSDVVLGDNGQITRRPLANGSWQKYPAPFADTIRDVIRFDDVDRIGGNDTLRGSAGDDILQGQRGNDWIDGGKGDDELIGQLGNDFLLGRSGQDFALGDTGIILRDYNPDGTPRLNRNQSWHRDALLLDVANLVDSYNLNAIPTNAFQDANIDSLLFTAAANGQGSVDSQVQALNFFDDGNDYLDGGSGDDSLFGQRGNDSIFGGDGNDYSEGNAGDDTIEGGSGDDFIVGDNATNIAPFNRELPTVFRGIHLIQQGAGLNFELGEFGTIVIPTLSLQPQTNDGLLTTVSLTEPITFDTAPQAPIAPLMRNGKTWRPLISLIPNLTHHLDLLSGNDRLSDVSGNNTLIGDNYASFLPLRTGNAEIDNNLDDLDTLMHHVSYDLHDLELALRNGQPQQTLSMANDQIFGGSDRDLIYGDDLTFYSPFLVRSPNQIATIGSTVNALKQVLGQLETSVNAKLFNVPNALPNTTLSWKNDVLRGGNGDDSILGGDAMMFAPLLNNFDYKFGDFWRYGYRPVNKAVRPTFQEFDWYLNNDNLDGGEGSDFMIGGYTNLISPIVTQTPTTADQVVKFRSSLNTLIADIENVWIRELHNRTYGIDYANRNRSHQLVAGNTIMSGGNGNDVMIGDNASIRLPIVNGQVTLGIQIQGGDLDVTEEGHNFFGKLPHTYDTKNRNLDSGFGQDQMFGGSGTDVMLGEQFFDWLYGQENYDYLFAGRGGDFVDGGSDSDNLIRYYANPSPDDVTAITPYIRPKLQLLLSPHLLQYLQEIAANRNTLALEGELLIQYPG